MTSWPVSLTTAPLRMSATMRYSAHRAIGATTVAIRPGNASHRVSATKTNHQAIAAYTVVLTQPRTAPVARAPNWKRWPRVILPPQFASTAPGFRAVRCWSNISLPISLGGLEQIDSQQTPTEAWRIERRRRDQTHRSLLITEDQMHVACGCSTRYRPVDGESRGVEALSQDHAGPFDQGDIVSRHEVRTASPRCLINAHDVVSLDDLVHRQRPLHYSEERLGLVEGRVQGRLAHDAAIERHDGAVDGGGGREKEVGAEIQSRAALDPDDPALTQDRIDVVERARHGQRGLRQIDDLREDLLMPGRREREIDAMDRLTTSTRSAGTRPKPAPTWSS